MDSRSKELETFFSEIEAQKKNIKKNPELVKFSRELKDRDLFQEPKKIRTKTQFFFWRIKNWFKRKF